MIEAHDRRDYLRLLEIVGSLWIDFETLAIDGGIRTLVRDSAGEEQVLEIHYLKDIQVDAALGFRGWQAIHRVNLSRGGRLTIEGEIDGRLTARVTDYEAYLRAENAA